MAGTFKIFSKIILSLDIKVILLLFLADLRIIFILNYILLLYMVHKEISVLSNIKIVNKIIFLNLMLVKMSLLLKVFNFKASGKCISLFLILSQVIHL